MEFTYDNGFERTATRVSVVCMTGNLVLAAMKCAAGILGRSGAMISDAVHSASDMAGGLIVVAGVRLSARPADDDHPYGHERFECIAALVLANLLFLVGVGIGWNALSSIRSGAFRSVSPNGIALGAAVLSIAVKEAMFWYTRGAALKLNSASLRAEAWDHRADALSSVGALIGIAGARMGFPVLEPLAGGAISLLIMKAAADVFKDAANKLTDRACDAETVSALHECAANFPGVTCVDVLNTREFGSRVYVDLEIRTAAETLRAAHAVAEGLHEAIEREFPRVKHVMIHVNPAIG